MLLSEELIISQLVKKFPGFYENQRCFACSKQPPNIRILKHINPVKNIPSHFLNNLFNIIVPSAVLLDGLFPSGFSVKALYSSVLSSSGRHKGRCIRGILYSLSTVSLPAA
jgi:hypothetical protein